MNTYLVTFTIRFNNGSIVVKANNKLQAIAIARKDFEGFTLTNVEADLTF